MRCINCQNITRFCNVYYVLGPWITYYVPCVGPIHNSINTQDASDGYRSIPRSLSRNSCFLYTQSWCYWKGTISSMGGKPWLVSCAHHSSERIGFQYFLGFRLQVSCLSDCFDLMIHSPRGFSYVYLLIARFYYSTKIAQFFDFEIYS